MHDRDTHSWYAGVVACLLDLDLQLCENGVNIVKGCIKRIDEIRVCSFFLMTGERTKSKVPDSRSPAWVTVAH